MQCCGARFAVLVRQLLRLTCSVGLQHCWVPTLGQTTYESYL
jgi:hypothetical protein